MEKVFLVMSVSRQINGDAVFLKPEKAFKSAAKADSFYESLKDSLSEGDGQFKPVKVQTSNGSINCMIELGKFIIEVEDE